MTICIAAIAESNIAPKIVYAADRLQTSSFGFEHGPKISALANVAIMYSGTTTYCTSILSNCVRSEPKPFVYVEDCVALLKHSAKETFQRIAEEKFLNVHGITISDFYKNINGYPQWFAEPIVREIKDFEKTYRYQVSFILAGFDRTGAARLYEISGSGEVEDKTVLGFAVIGEALDMSIPEITKQKYSPQLGLADVFLRVFNAKKIAERNGTVGKATDLGILFIENRDNLQEIKAWKAEDVAGFLPQLDQLVNNLRDNEAKYIAEVTRQLEVFFIGDQTKDEKPQKKAK